MSPVIRIPDEIYKRLESLAVGFDTPYSVIERLLEFYESTNQIGHVDKVNPSDSSSSINSSNKSSRNKKSRNIKLEKALKIAIGKSLNWKNYRLVTESVLKNSQDNKRVLCKYSSYSPDLDRWFWGIPEKYWKNWDEDFSLALILENDDQKGYSFLLLTADEVQHLIPKCSFDGKNEKKINFRYYKNDNRPHIQEWQEFNVKEHKFEIDPEMIKI